MFFEALAVIVFTFFASLGMVEAADWLLRHPPYKKIEHRVFVIAKLSTVPPEDAEFALRSLFSAAKESSGKVFVDSEGASEESLSLCERLSQRFEFSLFRGENELLTLFRSSLHND